MRRESAAVRARGLRLRFFADIVSELQKVTWPTLPEVRSLSVIVIIFSAIIGVILGSIDRLYDVVIRAIAIP